MGGSIVIFPSIPILIVQAGIIVVSGTISSTAIVPSIIGGVFLLVNGMMTVALTRYLEFKWRKDVHDEIEEELREDERI